MSSEETKIINERIDLLIGNEADHENLIKMLPLSEKIGARERYRKMRKKMMKVAEKYKENIAHFTLVDDGVAIKNGVTFSGGKFTWYGNTGLTERSLYCGTLVIDGETIFTSGTIAIAFEYLLSVSDRDRSSINSGVTEQNVGDRF